MALRDTMGTMENAQAAETITRTAADEMEHTVRLIFELANRGQFTEALAYYHPDTPLELAGSGALNGRYPGKAKIEELIEVAIKEYGQPRVHLEELHVVGPKVYVETSTRLEDANGPVTESREIHVLEFLGGKVRRHRVFTNAVPPPRLRPHGD